MKIFYGVQGTGNGHITRARVLAQKFKERGVSVDWMFTGRPKDQFFEMEIFGDWRWRKGLTFATHHGNIHYVRTALGNFLPTFIHDIRSIDLRGYDLVITDFEPVTAWAAKIQGIKTIGIGHQYAFGLDIPVAGKDPLGLWILKYFAPATLKLGLHWHHFNGPIVPPIIETQNEDFSSVTKKIIVYLPFEAIDDIVSLLKPFSSYSFQVYHPEAAKKHGNVPSNIEIKPLSRAGFKEDFLDCEGVICNAGFELPSESMHRNKKLLVKPLHGQVEQRSNALALERLGLGQVMNELDSTQVALWLQDPKCHCVHFPDVADYVVDWLLENPSHVDLNWTRSIWKDCNLIR